MLLRLYLYSTRPALYCTVAGCTDPLAPDTRTGIAAASTHLYSLQSSHPPWPLVARLMAWQHQAARRMRAGLVGAFKRQPSVHPPRARGRLRAEHQQCHTSRGGRTAASSRPPRMASTTTGGGSGSDGRTTRVVSPEPQLTAVARLLPSCIAGLSVSIRPPSALEDRQPSHPRSSTHPSHPSTALRHSNLPCLPTALGH